jgi:hypothetical protein
MRWPAWGGNARTPETGGAGTAVAEAGRPVVVTVHGTNDALPDATGSQWWQIGSPFAEALRLELANRGFADAEVVPHQWTGSNSDADRLAAASALAKTLTGLAKTGRPLAVLGHSHGGNIVMEALAHGTARRRLQSVVSFGTPFFTRRLKVVPWLIAVFQIILGLVVTPIMVGYIIAILGAKTGMKVEGVLFFGLLAVVGLASLRAGIRKVWHRRLATRNLAASFDAARWLVLHSPRDEAMRVLETAAALQPRYVTVESARRSLTAFAALAGVAGTLLLFGWHWRYFLDPIITKLQAGQYDFGTAVDFTFILLFPIVFAAIAGIIRLIAWLGGARAYAYTLNLLIHGGVVGAAYGGDAAFNLVKVTRTPPYAPSALEARIDALNLGGIDDSAIFQAAHQLYDSVVAADTVEGGIGDPDVMWKRLSDALYHNAYMRDAGVIAGVAEHLARGWRGALSGAGAPPSATS